MTDHLLTVTGEPGDFKYVIECVDPPTCHGWEECPKDHIVDGKNAGYGPYESDDEDPWDGMDEFEFHGELHTWHSGWTVPFQGCIVASSYTCDDSVHDILCDNGPGTYKVEADFWDEYTCLLIKVEDKK